MSFEFAMTADISKETVEAMIKAAVEAQTAHKVSKVILNVALTGDDRFGGGRSPTFTGATVTFEKSPAIPAGPVYR